MASILIHSVHVPAEARAALRAARDARPEHRDDLLVAAARIIRAETELPCADVRELVDLPGGDCD